MPKNYTRHDENTDTVRWSDDVTAPIIIPLICLVVAASVVICAIIKYLTVMYDRKWRSKSYEIGDPEPTDNCMIPPDFNSSVDQTDVSSEKAPLNLLRFSGVKLQVEKKKKNQVVRISTPDSEVENSTETTNGRLRIEANVHDSSNETNDSNFEDLEEFPQNLNHQNIMVSHHQLQHHSHSSHHSSSSDMRRNAPLATTESEV